MKGFTPSKDLSKIITTVAQLLKEPSINQTLTNYNNHCALMLRNDVRKEFIETITTVVVAMLKKIHSKTEELATAKSALEQKAAELETTLNNIKR
jgi:hypothetical protein